ncbi:MAG: hypothetical protein IJY39_03345 [Clostridia bacterium]|nr:hypothetical protein [Clostridia bacterium]
MKFVVYYCVVLFGCAVSLVLFFEDLNITAMSVVPIFLMGLSIFQVYLFKNEKGENYGSNYNEKEQSDIVRFMSVSMMLSVPLHIPFIFFWQSGYKLLSSAVYLFGLFGGALFFRLQNGRQVSDRLKNETKEAEEQKRREELGKWK